MLGNNLQKLLARCSPAELTQAISTLPNEVAEVLLHDWEIFARDKQRLPAGEWEIWLLLAGRGFGKSRTGSETVRRWANDNPIIHLVGATAGDVRDTMIEGPAGLLNIYPKHQRPNYEPSKRKITFHNGAIARLYSAEEPDRLRGPQCHKAWADELAAWKYEQETWDQLRFGLRLGDHPQAVVTTTPRPSPLIRQLVKDSQTYLTSGSTFENEANLAGSFLRTMKEKYEGTTLGRQELFAEILTDVEGALWSLKMIDGLRAKQAPPLSRIVVAVDPSANDGRDGDECGIVAAGIEGNTSYVLSDVSGMYSPEGWAKRAVEVYNELEADAIIAEKNQGGEMVRTILKQVDPTANVRLVHASRGKRTRAEPIAALYEQGRVKHLGAFPKLEDEMTTWVPSSSHSPNRIDALVWALSSLMLKQPKKVKRFRK